MTTTIAISADALRRLPVRVLALLEKSELRQLDYCLTSPKASERGVRWANTRVRELQLATDLLKNEKLLQEIWDRLPADERSAVQTFPAVPDQRWEFASLNALRRIGVVPPEPVLNGNGAPHRPATYLARKTNKSAADRELRAKMRGSGGGGPTKGHSKKDGKKNKKK